MEADTDRSKHRAKNNALAMKLALRVEIQFIC